MEREWPEVFDAMVELLEEQNRNNKRERLAALARQRAGTGG